MKMRLVQIYFQSHSSNNVLLESWVLNSTCLYHMTPKKDWFDTYKPYNGGLVQMGNDAICPVIGICTVKIKMFDGVVRVLSNVRHILDLRKNLISLGVLEDLGYSYTSKGEIMKITKGALMVMKGQKVSTLYRLIGNTVVVRVAVTTLIESSTDDTKLWHMRLGHIGECGVLELHKRNLLKEMKTCKLDICKYCVYEKQYRVSFKIGSHTSKGVLDYVHFDVWSLISVSSHSDTRYFVNFFDDHSRRVWIYFMRHKSDVFGIFKKWKAQVENQTSRKIKYFRIENGLEYRDKKNYKIL